MFSCFREIDENSIKFDLIIYEGLLHSAYLGFVPKLGYPPLITMQTLNPTCLFGIHCDIMICNPSYIPEILSGLLDFIILGKNIIESVHVVQYFFFGLGRHRVPLWPHVGT